MSRQCREKLSPRLLASGSSRRWPSAPIASPQPGPPPEQPPVVYDPRKPLECLVGGARVRPAVDRCACAVLILHFIRPPFSSPGFLAAFKLSHKIYLLFHEYISSRHKLFIYLHCIYFTGDLWLSLRQRGGEERSEQTEPAAGGRGREAGGRRRVVETQSMVPTAPTATPGWAR